MAIFFAKHVLLLLQVSISLREANSPASTVSRATVCIKETNVHLELRTNILYCIKVRVKVYMVILFDPMSLSNVICIADEYCTNPE